MRRERARRRSRLRRASLGNLLLVAGALVILAPLAISGYEEIMWRLEMKQYAEAPSPVLLTPVEQTPPEPGTVEPPSAPEETQQTEPPPQSDELQVLTFDRSKGIPSYQIEIPRIGITYLVGEGIDNPVLAKGPGHYPQTVLPGETGTAALAAHRTVRGRPAFFYSINELQPGDEIRIGYQDKTLTFEVETVYLTTPYDLSVLNPAPYPVLTLTTCDPPGSDEKRLIVTSRLKRITDINP